MEGKRVKDSRVTLSQIMLPQDANPMGNIHGGMIMKLVDEAGALCAMRHSQRQVVTVVIDSMTFHSPVYVGNLVTLEANLNWAGRTSMEVEVYVSAEDPLSGKYTHANTAFLVLVALDDQGQPTKVPPLILETDEERRRWTEAEKRRQRRLKR